MNGNIFDSGIPKYSTASDIYDGLCVLTNTEEMGIISQMFPDVSYENQEYYYTEKGSILKEKFNEIGDYGYKMWLMDLAVCQVDQSEIHDFVYLALINTDIAKRLNFKKLFIEYMLGGDKSDYEEITEEYLGELSELDRFENWEMIKAWNRVMTDRGETLYSTPYPTFCYHLNERMNGLKLDKERQLIIECRSLLTSYDDFILGLKMNQALYEEQEKSYQRKVAALQENFDQKLKLLMLAADRAGLLSVLTSEINNLSSAGTDLLESSTVMEE